MIHILTYSEVGGHRVNEDAFVARPHTTDQDSWLICLADGQGGRVGGAHAAKLACESAADLAANAPANDWVDSSVWQSILAQADTTLATDPAAGFTTLIGLGVRSDQIAGASSGDSAAVLFSNGTAQELTARQFKNPPVGSGEATFIPFEARPVRPWQLLVMSDGVWKYAGWDKIRDLAASTTGPELLTQLQDAARLRGTGAFPDDFTVILIEASD